MIPRDPAVLAILLLRQEARSLAQDVIKRCGREDTPRLVDYTGGG